MNSSYKIHPATSEELNVILTPKCLDFVSELHRLFNPKRLHLLEERRKLQQKIDEGWEPDFLEETRQIRNSTWTILSTPDDLLDRRVEITGPPVKKTFNSSDVVG